MPKASFRMRSIEPPKMKFTNSMNVGGLHSDSKPGTLHLHIDCCRVDIEGNTNDVHDIHLRAMKDDEDDWKFAHHYAQMAHSMCKPKPRSRSFHR